MMSNIFCIRMFRAVITIDVTHLEIMIRNERIKHSHWVSLDPEYVRFTPVLTPHLLSNEEKAVEKEVKEIQIVFKEIGRDAAEYERSILLLVELCCVLLCFVQFSL